MAEGVLERTWGSRTRSSRQSVVGFVVYMLSGVLGALLALWGSDGFRQIAWTLFGGINFLLGITLAVSTLRRSEPTPPSA